MSAVFIFVAPATFKPEFIDTSDSTRSPAFRLASPDMMILVASKALIVAVPATFRPEFIDTSDATTRPAFRLASESIVNLDLILVAPFNVVIPATFKPLFIDTSCAKSALPATYNFAFKEASSITNRLPFNERSSVTINV